MADSKEKIISDIKDHMQRNGGAYKDWYVGIAADARDRLFNGHGVHEQGDAWIYRTATSNLAARDVEDHFHALGCDGGPGGGDQNTDKVYAYKKNAHTNP